MVDSTGNGTGNNAPVATVGQSYDAVTGAILRAMQKCGNNMPDMSNYATTTALTSIQAALQQTDSNIMEKLNEETAARIAAIKAISNPGSPDLSGYATTVYADDIRVDLTKLLQQEIAAIPQPDLSAYAKTADVNTLLQDYTKSADIVTEIKNAVDTIHEPDLSPYAKSADVTSEIAAAVANIHEPDLTGYAKQADIDNELKNYVKLADEEGELGSYVKSADLPNVLAPYAKTSDIAGQYATSNDVANQLGNYAKSIDVATQLSSYAKSADVNTTLASYARTNDVYNALQGYAKPSDITNALSGYTKSSDIVTEIQNAVNSIHEPDLSGYAKIADVASQISNATSGLAKASDLSNQLSNYARLSDLGQYAKSADVSNQLLQIVENIKSQDMTPYATVAGVNSLLANYATSNDVKNEIEVALSGITTGVTVGTCKICGGTGSSCTCGNNSGTTNNGVTLAVVDAEIQKAIAGLSTPDLSNYAKTADVTTALVPYAKSADVANEIQTAVAGIKEPDLTPYAKTADVTTAINTAVGAIKLPDLTQYAKTTDLISRLSTYATISDLEGLQDELPGYVSGGINIAATATTGRSLFTDSNGSVTYTDNANRAIPLATEESVIELQNQINNTDDAVNKAITSGNQKLTDAILAIRAAIPAPIDVSKFLTQDSLDNILDVNLEPIKKSIVHGNDILTQAILDIRASLPATSGADESSFVTQNMLDADLEPIKQSITAGNNKLTLAVEAVQAAIPAPIDVSQYTTKTQVDQEITNSFAGLSVAPVGTPQLWVTNTIPTGWLVCNGAEFDTADYPYLAKVFPSGTLPDLRSSTPYNYIVEAK